METARSVKTPVSRKSPLAARMLRLAAIAVFAIAVAGGLVASPAFADGGPHPSAAPALPFGQHVTGGAPEVDGGGSWIYPDTPGVEYWRVPLQFGDVLTLDYEHIAGTETGVCMLSPDINDYTVADSECLNNWQFDTTDAKAELTFTASATGGWLLAVFDYDCCNDEAWGYDLVATVQHRATLSVPAMSTLALQGTVAIGVGSPNGAPISDGSLDVALQILVDRKWTTIGHASPSNGVANVSYSVPSPLARRKLRVRAVATGPAYVTGASTKQSVALPPALSVKLPKQRRIHPRGRFVVSAPGYDGATFSDRYLKIVVQMRTSRGWRAVGSRWVENSLARIRLRIPRHYRGKRLTLRARVTGEYPRQTSAKRRYVVR